MIYNANGGIDLVKGHEQYLEQKTVDYIVQTINEFIREGEPDLFVESLNLIDRAELYGNQTECILSYIKFVLSDENVNIQKQIKRDSLDFAKEAVEKVADDVYNKLDQVERELKRARMGLTLEIVAGELEEAVKKRFSWVYENCGLEVEQTASEKAQELFYHFYDI